MKKLVVVEIDYPEEFDMVWDADETGAQVYNDTIHQFAVEGATRSLFDTIMELKDKGIPDDKHNEDRYYKFIKRKVDTVITSKSVGYIKDGKTFIMGKEL